MLRLTLILLLVVMVAGIPVLQERGELRLSLVFLLSHYDMRYRRRWRQALEGLRAPQDNRYVLLPAHEYSDS